MKARHAASPIRPNISAPSGASSAPRFYRPELDAVRFIAFLGVFIRHFDIPGTWWSHHHDVGAAGMPLFFFLSAYLIVFLLLREEKSTGGVDVRAFFIRRVLRIWPLFYLVLLLAVVIGYFHEAARLPGHSVVALSLLVGNFWVAKHGWMLKWAAPLWSLSVEEQFYLGIPVLMKWGGRRAMTRIFAGVVVLSYARLLWLGMHHALPFVGIWVDSMVQFQFFAAGGLLAIWYSTRPLQLTGRLRGAVFFGGAFLLALADRRLGIHRMGATPTLQLISGYLVTLIGTTAFFIGVIGTKVRIPAPLIYLGKISFGLYMFHELFLWFLVDSATSRLTPKQATLRAVAALLATVATAALSYRFFETPFLKLKYRFERVHARPA